MGQHQPTRAKPKRVSSHAARANRRTLCERANREHHRCGPTPATRSTPPTAATRTVAATATAFVATNPVDASATASGGTIADAVTAVAARTPVVAASSASTAPAAGDDATHRRGAVSSDLRRVE